MIGDSAYILRAVVTSCVLGGGLSADFSSSAGWTCDGLGVASADRVPAASLSGMSRVEDRTGVCASLGSVSDRLDEGRLLVKERVDALEDDLI